MKSSVKTAIQALRYLLVEGSSGRRPARHIHGVIVYLAVLEWERVMSGTRRGAQMERECVVGADMALFGMFWTPHRRTPHQEVIVQSNGSEAPVNDAARRQYIKFFLSLTICQANLGCIWQTVAHVNAKKLFGQIQRMALRSRHHSRHSMLITSRHLRSKYQPKT